MTDGLLDTVLATMAEKIQSLELSNACKDYDIEKLKAENEKLKTENEKLKNKENK